MSNRALREMGNVTEDIDLTFGFTVDPTVPLKHDDVTIQAQIIYSRLDGGRYLRVITKTQRVTSKREESEVSMDASIVALKAVQESAKIAQLGDYQKARINLISHQRMLQRGMKRRDQQRAYINFIKQGEKLDGFMREAQAQEAIFGKSEDTSNRDDSAAKNIVQMKGAPLSVFAC